MGHSPPLFYICLFNNWQWWNVLYNNLSMTGFKLRISGVGSDHSTNWATTTALSSFLLYLTPLSLSFASSYVVRLSWISNDAYIDVFQDKMFVRKRFKSTLRIGSRLVIARRLCESESLCRCHCRCRRRCRCHCCHCHCGCCRCCHRSIREKNCFSNKSRFNQV